MEHFSADLWKQYEARPANDKFLLVCVVHNAFATKWLVEFGQDWVRAGALRLMPISAQYVLLPASWLPSSLPCPLTLTLRSR
jgi:hypothetical protein